MNKLQSINARIRAARFVSRPDHESHKATKTTGLLHLLRMMVVIFAAMALVPNIMAAGKPGGGGGPGGGTVVNFSMSDAGTTKSIPRWGIEVVRFDEGATIDWINAIGANEIDVVATLFWMDEPLQGNGQIGQTSKDRIDGQEYLVGLVGSNKPIQLQPATADGVNSWYWEGANGALNVQRWADLIEATAAYYSSPIDQIIPFNEPDYGWGQGSGQDLYDIMGLINVQGAWMSGPSTLNSDWAQPWYDAIIGRADIGGTHCLNGSMQTYIDFISYVQSHNDSPSNPELHSLAEAIVGAEYGLDEGIWWAGPNLARSTFVLDCQHGKRLGYAEERNNWCAAAVYRGSDGSVHAYASGSERQASNTSFTFHSVDGPVYFNGQGPQTDFTVTVGAGNDTIVDIVDGSAAIFPTGSGLSLVNRASGLTLTANGSGNGSNVMIDSVGRHLSSNQKWTIEAVGAGLYSIRSAQSGSRGLDCNNWGTSNGTNIQIWDYFAELNQLWVPVDLGNGYWSIESANAPGQCLDASGTSAGSNVQLWSYNGGNNQQWEVQ